MLIVIMIIYAAGISVAGFATNIFFMFLARVIQGVGISMLPIAFSLVRDRLPPEKFSIGQGIITSMFAAGAVLGLIVGGTIVQNYGWQATFLTTIPVALLLLVMIGLYIESDRHKDNAKERNNVPEVRTKIKIRDPRHWHRPLYVSYYFLQT